MSPWGRILDPNSPRQHTTEQGADTNYALLTPKGWFFQTCVKSTVPPRWGQGPILLRAAADDRLGQVPHLLQMLQDKERQVSWPPPCYQVADKRDMICYSFLMPSGAAYVCSWEQVQIYCTAEMRCRVRSSDFYNQGGVESTLCLSQGPIPSLGPCQQSGPLHLALGGSRTSSSKHSSPPTLFKSASHSFTRLSLSISPSFSLSHIAIL